MAENTITQMVAYQPEADKWVRTSGSADIKFVDGECQITPSSTARTGIRCTSLIHVDGLHKYLYVYDARSDSEITVTHILSYYQQDFVLEGVRYSTEWTRFARIAPPRFNVSVDNGCMCVQWLSLPVDNTVYVKNFYLFDLTEAFGEGNEPSTPDDFAHRLGFPSINELPYIKPAWPFPTTPLAFRVAALLTYANETTGAGDTLLGDAVKTLVEGYGGGEPVDDWNYVLRDAVRGVDPVLWGDEVYSFPIDSDTMIEVCIDMSQFPFRNNNYNRCLQMGGNTGQAKLYDWGNWEHFKIEYKDTSFESRQGTVAMSILNTNYDFTTDINHSEYWTLGLRDGFFYVNGVKAVPLYKGAWDQFINGQGIKIGMQSNSNPIPIYIKYIRYKQLNP